MSDASDTGIGGVLQQRQADNSVKPISFAARSLLPSERKYAISEKECLALVFAINQFRPFILGQKVRIITDHKALLALTDKNKLKNRRLLSWALTIQPYLKEIKYLPGKEMIPADCLSRGKFDTEPEIALAESIPTIASINSSYSSTLQTDFASAQHQDKNLSPLINYLSHKILPSNRKLSTRIIEQAKSYHLYNNILFKHDQIVIPKTFINLVLEEAHGNNLFGHCGIKKTLNRLNWCCWKNKSIDVQNHVNSCTQCMRTKPASKPYKPSLSTTTPTPYIPFAHLIMDVIGPLPISNRGNRYILTIIDRASRWLEAYPMLDLSSRTTATIFVQEFISRYGSPLTIQSDNGSNFTAEVFSEMAKLLKSDRKFSTPYSPWCNGAIEKANGTIVQLLKTFTSEHPQDWDLALPLCLLAYRTSINKSIQCSPYEFLFGVSPRMPLQEALEIPSKLSSHAIVRAKALANERKYRASSSSSTSQINKNQTISQNQLVFTKNQFPKNKLSDRWLGPYPVIREEGKHSVIVRTNNGQEKPVHRRHIKIAHPAKRTRLESSDQFVSWQ